MGALAIDRIAAVKEALPARDVLEHYGFPVTRGRAVCPFHNDSHPSLYVYPGSRGWHCYACGAGGSVIDFAVMLFKLSPLDAARRLSADFGLGLFKGPGPDRGKVIELQRAREARERETMAFRDSYMDKVKEVRELHALRRMGPPMGHEGEYASLMGRLEWLEYWFQENGWR